MRIKSKAPAFEDRRLGHPSLQNHSKPGPPAGLPGGEMGIVDEAGTRKRGGVSDFARSCVDLAHENQVKSPSLRRPKTGAPVTSESFKARATRPVSKSPRFYL